MRPQTQETKTIHPIERKGMITPKLKLTEQWGQKNKSLLEQTSETSNATKNQQQINMSKIRTTQITQLIERYPEIPEEMDLNGDGRKT